MGLKLNPRASESMQMSKPLGHYIYKKLEVRISKVLKLCFTSKPDRAYALRPLMDLKMNPRAPESMQISNPRGHHINMQS